MSKTKKIFAILLAISLIFGFFGLHKIKYRYTI